MNVKLSLCLTAFLLICNLWRICNSYIISEPEKIDQILINSFLENKRLESNVLDTKSVKTGKSKTYENQTISTDRLKHNSIATKKTNSKVKSCYFCNKEKQQPIKKEDQYIQRLEYIKLQILSKLGMSEAPKLLNKNTDTSNYLQVLEASPLALPSGQSQEVLTKPEPIESDKLFIFPKVKRLNIPQFNISIAKDSFDVESIKTITLFVKQKLNPNIDENSVDKELVVISTAVPIDGVLSRYHEISNIRVLGIVDPQNDKLNDEDRQLQYIWLRYDLSRILKPEVLKVNKLVSFDSESFDMKESFITVEQHNTNLMRSRRTIDCADNSTSCCRENFFVNFTNIGWDNWILQPPGYNANFCKGKCDISNARYHHTTVIGKYPAISLCCSPREMSHISLIYLDDKGVVFHKNLGNMVVESCDCA